MIIGPAALPTIATQPQSLTLNPNAGFSLTVGVDPTSVGPFTYQWYLNGVAIPGAFSATFTSLASSFNAGVYTVTVTNSGGTVTSTGATLTVNAAPVISIQPRTVTASTGSTVVLNIAATGTPKPTL